MNNFITPKKSLGQHFLKDENIASQIVNALSDSDKFVDVLEIGPGMGVLTKYLMNRDNQKLYVIEKDRMACEYLIKNLGLTKDRIINDDVLDYELNDIFPFEFGVIGNFPYNISTQILFKVLDYRNRIPEVVGMFQKEVGERIAAGPDNKTYGILSVLLQTYYNVQYLFTVDENVFSPPPKVKSAVVKLTRNSRAFPDCDEDLLFKVVKTTFNHRRKMLRNTLKPFGKAVENIDESFMIKRPENLSVDDFIYLTKTISG